MKVTKAELESRGWIWFRAFEKRFLVNVLKAQDFFIVWRRSLQSVEFWNLSWLWTAFLMQICSLKIRFAIGQGTKKQLMSWVSSLVPVQQHVAQSFPECFSDGILLCALVEKLVNGACPRYDLLDPEQPLRNLKLALHLVEKYIKIKPALTAEEIQEGNFSDRSLLLLIAQMKLMSEKYNLSIDSVNIEKDYISPTTFVSEKCFARGMGLLLAVRGRRACFTILLYSIDDLDMVIEITGPKNTACRKRIASILAISKNDSRITGEKSDAEIHEDIAMMEIPLEYSIVGQKITVNYTPLESGTHQMSIIWQGQHIMGSPYSISVDCSVEAPDIWPAAPKKVYGRLNRTYSQCEESVPESDDTRLESCPESLVTIKKKRVLRYIVKIDGNDVVIDGNEDICEAINSIKRDQENPSSIRGNSLDSPNQFVSKFSISDSENFKMESNTGIKCDSPHEQDLTDDSPDFTMKMDKKSLSHIQGENHELVKSDEINFSKCSESRFSVDGKEVFINEKEDNKMTMKTEETNNFNLSCDEYFESNPMDESNKMNEEEMSNIMYSEEDDSPSVSFTDENKPKLRVSFCDENIIESDSVLKPNKFSSNFSHLDVKDMSPQSDDFFPVHKVAYEILHDDDDDEIDVPIICCNLKRRRSSVTELNESNYLDDDDVNDIELNNNELEAQVPSEAEIEIFPINIEEKYQKELKDYADIDKDNHQKTNHSLFECDHSLSFFTETLVETPPELAELEKEGHSDIAEENISNSWESKLSELNNETSRFYCEKSVELEECKTSKRTRTGSLERSSSLTDVYDYEDSEAIDPYSFHYTDLSNLSKLEEDEFYLSKFTNSLDLADKRKRLSWCDREPLPLIRESSIEGLLDIEIDNNTDEKPEIMEDVPHFDETRINNQSDPQNIAISSSSTDNETKFDKIVGAVCSTKEDTEVKIKTSVENNELVFNESNKVSSSKIETAVENKELVNNGSNKVSSNKIVTAVENNELVNNGSNKVSNNKIVTAVENNELVNNESNKVSSNLLETKDNSQMHSLSENTNKTVFSSMKIYSATPFRNRNQDSNHSEFKFSPIINSEKPPLQTVNSSEPKTLPNPQGVSSTFILAHAKPAFVEECQNSNGEAQKAQEMNENVSDKVFFLSDSCEIKSAQCNSVKRVIQIFQKEKEEPLDTWPTEAKNCNIPCCYRPSIDECSTEENNMRNELIQPKYCSNISIIENSCSSIKERVKLFERESQVMKSQNISGKPGSSSINAKKQYWENITYS